MTTSDRISLIALAVSLISAIANYLYIKRSFEATSLPHLEIEVISETPKSALKLGEKGEITRNSSNINIYISNLSSSVRIINIHTIIIISGLSKKERSENKVLEYTIELKQLDADQKKIVCSIGSDDIARVFPSIAEIAIMNKDQVRENIVNTFVKYAPEFAKIAGEQIPEKDLLAISLGLVPKEFEESMSSTMKDFPQEFQYTRFISKRILAMKIQTTYRPGITGGRKIQIGKSLEIQPHPFSNLELLDALRDGGSKLDSIFSWGPHDEVQGWNIKEA